MTNVPHPKAGHDRSHKQPEGAKRTSSARGPASPLISPALDPGSERPEEEAGSTEGKQGQKCQRVT